MQSTTFTLTKGQEEALDAFWTFLTDPKETVFVLSGYSGCGKSTLIETLLDRLEAFYATTKLLDPSYKELEVALTATTNKAAENLARITGREVTTIHSKLGLRVDTDFRTGVTTLTRRSQYFEIRDLLLFIDEASFMEPELLQMTFKIAKDCKIVFIGDPAQLAPVKSSGTPVFEAGFKGAALTEVVRQAKGNPIVDLSTKFRETVNSGEFFSFTPDGEHVVHMDRDSFNAEVLKEFARPDWRFNDSKILAWTNKCVIGFNNFVRSHAKGSPKLQVGDYAIVNSFVVVGKQSLKTDQLVEITAISPEIEVHDVLGHWVTCNHTVKAFMPNLLADKNAKIKSARAAKLLSIAFEIEQSWIDLRAAYACTINKAQGSTYDKVFIDLDDVSRCNSTDQLARMLYVAVSRARTKVFFTGDLV